MVELSMKELKQEFKKLDRNGDGKIDEKELKRYLKSKTGKEPTTKEIQDLIKHSDIDGDNAINFKEFIASDEIEELLKKISDGPGDGKPKKELTAEELKKYFKRLDRNGDGKIDRKELTKFLVKMGQDPSKKEVTKLMKSADNDGDKEIDFEEFIASDTFKDLLMTIKKSQKKSSVSKSSSSSSAPPPASQKKHQKDSSSPPKQDKKEEEGEEKIVKSPKSPKSSKRVSKSSAAPAPQDEKDERKNVKSPKRVPKKPVAPTPRKKEEDSSSPSQNEKDEEKKEDIKSLSSTPAAPSAGGNPSESSGDDIPAVAINNKHKEAKDGTSKENVPNPKDDYEAILSERNELRKTAEDQEALIKKLNEELAVLKNEENGNLNGIETKSMARSAGAVGAIGAVGAVDGQDTHAALEYLKVENERLNEKVEEYEAQIAQFSEAAVDRELELKSERMNSIKWMNIFDNMKVFGSMFRSNTNSNEDLGSNPASTEDGETPSPSK